jgi:anaerobic magnesium-protoporphyrin IX monomethyl ester cyclase
MKILLVQPPVNYDLPLCFRAESLGLGYLASVLRRDGYDVTILDALLRSMTLAETVDDIAKRDFDVLGVTANHEQKQVLYSVVRSVRKRRKDAIIVAGGYLPTLSTGPLLGECPELDFVVVGEGEVVICDAFGRIARGDDWRGTPGIAYLRDRSLVSNPCPPLIQDLDSLPFPARDAIVECGFPVTVRVAGTRGCYRRCSFCCIRGFYEVSGGHAPRHRSPANVVAEIESVASATRLRDFRFIDDSFIGPTEKTRNWALEIARGIKSLGMDITFAIECRVDEVDRDVLLALKDAGATQVFLGVESGVQRQLDTYWKRTTVEQNRKAIEIVRECGLRLWSGFMMFDPYLTVPELAQNMEFVTQTGIAKEAMSITHAPFLSKVHLYHGMPLVEQLRQEGLLHEKGTELGYTFKYRSIRLIYHILRSVSWISTILRRLGRKPANG